MGRAVCTMRLIRLVRNVFCREGSERSTVRHCSNIAHGVNRRKKEQQAKEIRTRGAVDGRRYRPEAERIRDSPMDEDEALGEDASQPSGGQELRTDVGASRRVRWYHCTTDRCMSWLASCGAEFATCCQRRDCHVSLKWRASHFNGQCSFGNRRFT